MPIPNPYEAVNVTAAPELEALAREYRAIGERLCSAINRVETVHFTGADVTHRSFAALGRELKRSGFVPRLTTAFEQRHGKVPNYARQRAIYGAYEMTLAAVARDRPRFDRAFTAVTADAEAAEHLLREFREAGELLKGWVYHPHLRRFHQRAAELLRTNGVAGTFSVGPDDRLWIEDVALRLFREHLSDEAFAALAVWKDWQGSPSGYGVQVDEDGEPFPTPHPPTPVVSQEKPPEIPVWDVDDNTLTVGESYTKKCARQAKNVREVLNTFQNKQWAEKVANPLPGKVFSVVLRDVNNSLGEKCPIRFRGDGSGNEIIWEHVGGLSTTPGNSQEVSSVLA